MIITLFTNYAVVEILGQTYLQKL